jgi:hypothetical protein
MVGGGRRRHRKDDFGGDFPVVPDPYPIDDQQKRLRCPVLASVRDRDGRRHIGFRRSCVRPTTLSFEKSGLRTTGPEAAMSCSF